MRKYFLTIVFLVMLFAVHAQPIRGTWITNVASKALTSEKNIEEAINNCKKFGLNTVFVVVWNAGKTMYPSEVAYKYSGTRQDPVYGSFDPLATIIDKAHQANIKVYAWFEYGFAYAYNDSNTLWFRKYPHWTGKNASGGLLKKNNFFWWNSLHPEVQKMMTELVCEVVRNYKVDGIQGDDRLPAMPAEGGYDEYTLNLYAREHNGNGPPKNPLDSAWVQWKADKLSAYGKALYAAVKKERSDCLVSWAPSIYPWSKENYLQDWPKWLKEGYADNVLPQLYRYDIKAYEKILKELSEQVPAEFKKKVFPGILTSLGNGYRVKEDMLREMIRLNRQYGFEGECFFYYETLPSLKEQIY